MAQQAAAPDQSQPAEKPAAVEKQTNCLGCNKPLKKLKRYYRNGKYYCTKVCWRKTLQKTEAGQQKGVAS